MRSKKYFVLYAVLVFFFIGVAPRAAHACFGNGTTCGIYLQAFSGIGNDWESTVLGGVRYFARADLTTPGLSVFRWTTTGSAPCGSGGGLGDGSACTTALQSVGLTTTNPGTYSVDLYAKGADTFLALADPAFDDTTWIFKWMESPNNCFGNGSACGSSFSTIPGYSPFDAIGFTIGSTPYVVVDDLGHQLFTWMSAQSCYGNGTTCGTYLQNLAGVAVRTGEIFTVGGATFYAGAYTPDGFSVKVDLYKWQTTGTAPCSSGGAWGNGSTCGTAYQSLSGSGNSANSGVNVFTISTDTYLGFTFGSTNSYLYKWQTTGAAPCGSGGAWGNGSTCGTALQTFSSVIKDLDVFTADTMVYAVAHGSSTALYQWMPGSSCFGEGTTCGVALQTFNGGDRGAVFSEGGTTYVLSGVWLYKWMVAPPSDACPSAVPAATGGSGFKLDPSVTKRYISATQCVTNSSGYTWFIPPIANTAEFNAFVAAYNNGQLSGLAISAR